jgi:hypothetical protein
MSKAQSSEATHLGVGTSSLDGRHCGAIRGLQANIPREVTDYLELEPDGSFTIDTLTIEARAG